MLISPIMHVLYRSAFITYREIKLPEEICSDNR